MHRSGHQVDAYYLRSGMTQAGFPPDSRRSEPSRDWPTHPCELSTIAQLGQLCPGTEVTFRARIVTQRQLSKTLSFLLLRDQTCTVQGVLSQDDVPMTEWVHKLHPESLVQISGALREPPEPIRTATYADIEVDVNSVHLITAAHVVPFRNYKPPGTLRNRMCSRILDLRHPSNQALFRIRSLVTRLFRQTFENLGFVEINTPKLQPVATESSLAVFNVNYFGRSAFLAQSPQLAKQMSISADFGRVYEIGPVFRAERSSTRRHLTEYTGLDIEMALKHDYHEVISLIDQFLKATFKAVYEMHDLAQVQKRWASKPLKWLNKTLVLDFRQGLEMLRKDGREVDDAGLAEHDEIRLGQLVRDNFDTDYYILDKFPAVARPFYTRGNSEGPDWTNSFDIFIRGREICSGGQRINDAEEIRSQLRSLSISEEEMADYLAAFDLGMPPHGGAGLGLERIIAWMLELGDIRYASLFYRDPQSLPERSLSLAHPEADTTKSHPHESPPPIEKLIANYGDATNTSWLDDRFEIWRHPTGSAVGYARHEKFAVVMGDPLCDAAQYVDVCESFVSFVDSELRLVPVWMLVSFEVQTILAERMGWRTLSCTEEQRLDTTQCPTTGGGLKARRRMERDGVRIHEVRVETDFIKRADTAVQEWKASRKGKQFHLTEILPWVDQDHRRYFAAEKDDKVIALVVVAKLSEVHGWQVKWALDFPASVNGAIEVLIDYAIQNLSGKVTFGAGVSKDLTPGRHLSGVRARFLGTAYRQIVEKSGLDRKTVFRKKFGTFGEGVYICYPKQGVTVLDLRQLVSFFRD